jgi:hypothetical protein
LIDDQHLVYMDDDKPAAIFEQPGSMLDTPVRLALNGGAGRVFFNADCTKPASAPDSAGKF